MRRHFHTFDALRFFAFFKVFLLHVPITAFPLFNFLKAGGGIGVSFFFVLSGFLISYIILSEKESSGTIKLSKFFMRRILRIWPLFYIMILFAFLTPYILDFINLESSPQGYQPNWLMSIAFLENYKMISLSSVPNVSPLGIMWSICIEEHFYIIWGISFFFIKTKNIPYFLFSTIVIANIGRLIFYHYNLNFSDILTNIDFFAYGAFPAYLLISKKKTLENKILDLKNTYKISFIIITITYVILSPHLHFSIKDFVEPSIFGLLFSGIIIITLPEKSKIKIGNKNILTYLGLFTYGLYLYHIIIVNLMKQIFNRFQISLDSVLNASFFVVISLALTILISIASYHLFEKHFLKFKKYFR